MNNMGQEFNFIVQNDNTDFDLIDILFDGEDVQSISGADMFDILVMTGMFRSKSEARKNWKRTGKDIPEGFTDLENLGKLHNRITIWNPKQDKNRRIKC